MTPLFDVQILGHDAAEHVDNNSISDNCSVDSDTSRFGTEDQEEGIISDKRNKELDDAEIGIQAQSSFDNEQFFSPMHVSTPGTRAFNRDGVSNIMQSKSDRAFKEEIDLGTPFYTPFIKDARSIYMEEQTGDVAAYFSASSRSTSASYTPLPTPYLELRSGDMGIINERNVSNVASPFAMTEEEAVKDVGAVPLPYPWVQYVSEEGWPYYYNPESNQSSWDPPTSSNAVESNVFEAKVDANEESYLNQTDISVDEDLSTHNSLSASRRLDFSPGTTNVHLINSPDLYKSHSTNSSYTPLQNISSLVVETPVMAQRSMRGIPCS